MTKLSKQRLEKNRVFHQSWIDRGIGITSAGQLEDSKTVLELLAHITALNEEIAELRSCPNESWECNKVQRELRAENEKQAARISELEAGLKSIKSMHSHGRSCVFVNDEWDCELNSVEAIAHSLLSPKDTQGEG